MLKTLEEPGENIVIILLADHYLKLPATIRSRLQHFALDRISSVQFSEYVEAQLPEAGSSQQQLLMNLSNQMPLQAVEVAQSSWLPLRQEFMEDWKNWSFKNMPMAIATKWNKSLSFGEFGQMFEYLLSDLICVKLNQAVKTLIWTLMCWPNNIHWKHF